MEGLLPTPKASDALAERSRSGGRPPERSTALGMQIGLLPTPKASDANGPGAHGDGGPNLNTTMNDPRHYVPDSMFIPTPRASDVKGFNQRRNQENLTGAMLLGVESDRDVQWGRFEPAIGRPAPCPLQATGSLRERLVPLAGTLMNPRWLVMHAPRRSGPALPDQPERDRTVRRWRAMSDGSDLIDPAVWDERWVADVDRPIPADRMPAPCVRRLWACPTGGSPIRTCGQACRAITGTCSCGSSATGSCPCRRPPPSAGRAGCMTCSPPETGGDA